MINLFKEYDNIKFSSKNALKKAMNRTQTKYGEYHTSVNGNKLLYVMTGFENINLGINIYECFALLGPNDSGKTSLINSLSLTHSLTIGDIIYDGKNA